MSDARDRKLRRLASGEAPRLLDLFSGCGGLTLGFQRAGFLPVAGVEIDEHASRSHALNFHGHVSPRVFEAHAAPKDVTKTSPTALLEGLGISNVVDAIDVVVGGPPCPTFTRVGRAKLREVHQHPEAFLHDPRSQLYVPYLRFVEQLQPLALLMENVPDFLNWGGHNLAEEICEVLEGLGFQCSYTLLNAAQYGVPQMRERFILAAVHSSVGSRFVFPKASNRVSFPPGYDGTRDVALRVVRDLERDGSAHRYVAPPAPAKRARGPVTVREAIEDLPIITGHLDGSIRRGARRFDEPVKYRDDVTTTDYATEMRSWPGFDTPGHVVDHVIRSLSDRDYRLFRHMRHGDDYPKAHALAEELFAEEMARLARLGIAPSTGTDEHERLLRTYVPPYDPGKFPNKWRKMEPDLPARTLMAHLGKDSYSHIHYDSDQARVLSVREAARLQSFPDAFRFSGTMNPALRQIGNAVPPLFSFALGRQLFDQLATAVGRDRARLEQVAPQLRLFA